MILSVDSSNSFQETTRGELQYWLCYTAIYCAHRGSDYLTPAAIGAFFALIEATRLAHNRFAKLGMIFACGGTSSRAKRPEASVVLRPHHADAKAQRNLDKRPRNRGLRGRAPGAAPGRRGACGTFQRAQWGLHGGSGSPF